MLNKNIFYPPQAANNKFIVFSYHVLAFIKSF